MASFSQRLADFDKFAPFWANLALASIGIGLLCLLTSSKPIAGPFTQEDVDHQKPLRVTSYVFTIIGFIVICGVLWIEWRSKYKAKTDDLFVGLSNVGYQSVGKTFKTLGTALSPS